MIRGVARPPTTRERWLIAVFFALVALPFLTIFPYFAATNNPNENTRTFMTMALVEEGTFQLDRIVDRQGWTNDMARVKGKDGVLHWYCVKGPANGYMGVPVYWAFRKIAPVVKIPVPTVQSPVEERIHWLRMSTWIIRLGSVALPCFLFLIWFERYLRGFSSDVVIRLTAVAAAGIGTNYLGYALMNVSHALFAVSSFLCFGLAERELRTRRDPRQRRPWVAFLAGLCAGWTTMLEYHGLPMSVVLTIFGFAVFYRPTRLLSYAAGGLVCIALVMIYQNAQFGNPFTPGHLNVENPLWAEEHKRGIFGIILPSKESVLGLSLPVGSGFFGMSPYMWLGVLAIPLAVLPIRTTTRSRRVLRTGTLVWVLTMAVLWFAASGAIEWRAGWTLGPRRLGAAPPFLALGAVCVLERFARGSVWRRAVARGVGAGAALAGVFAVGLVGIVYNTLPESALRPLWYFAMPLVQAGFVPHHVGEWFGATGIAFWYVVFAALVIAPLSCAFVPAGERALPRLVRAGTFLVAFAVCIAPQFTTPQPEEVGDHAPSASAWMPGWEPAGRDRITKMREDAERYGPRRPCAWHRLADLEEMVHLPAMAEQHRQRARAPRGRCPKLLF